MRVHIAIVGINRSLQHTFPSLVRELHLNKSSTLGASISSSLSLIWPQGNQINNPRSKEAGVLESRLPEELSRLTRLDLDQSEIDAAIDRPALLTLAEKTFARDTPETLVNLFRFLYALRETFAAEIAPNAPDVVVFARPDVRINGRLWLRWRIALLLGLRMFTPKVAILPAWGKNRGLNDRFAILTFQAAEEYFGRIDYALDYFSKHPDSNTEKFLAQALKSSLVLSAIATPMPRIRIGGSPAGRDERLDQTSPQKLWIGIVKARLNRLKRRLSSRLRGSS